MLWWCCSNACVVVVRIVMLIRFYSLHTWARWLVLCLHRRSPAQAGGQQYYIKRLIVWGEHANSEIEQRDAWRRYKECGGERPAVSGLEVSFGGIKVIKGMNGSDQRVASVAAWSASGQIDQGSTLIKKGSPKALPKTNQGEISCDYLTLILRYVCHRACRHGFYAFPAFLSVSRVAQPSVRI